MWAWPGWKGGRGLKWDLYKGAGLKLGAWPNEKRKGEKGRGNEGWAEQDRVGGACVRNAANQKG